MSRIKISLACILLIGMSYFSLSVLYDTSTDVNTNWHMIHFGFKMKKENDIWMEEVIND
jgi:predicted small integral membrane protein